MQCTSGYAGGWLCHLFLKGISWFLSGGIRLDSHKAGLVFIKESLINDGAEPKLMNSKIK